MTKRKLPASSWAYAVSDALHWLSVGINQVTAKGREPNVGDVLAELRRIQQMVGSPQAADAVDPHAADTGTPSTRV